MRKSPAIAFSEIGKSGRFFPFYWLYYTAIHGVVGSSPVGFYIANVLVFLGIISLIGAIVLLHGGSSLQACLSSLFFVLSGPVIENLYTLSKAEPLQLFMVALSFLVSLLWGRRKTIISFSLGAFLAMLLFLGAITTKETSVFLIPAIVAASAIVPFLGRSRELARGYAIFAVAAVIATVAFFLLRAQFHGIALDEGSYTRNYSVTADRVLSSALRWASWIMRDFQWALPMVVSLFLIARRLTGPLRQLVVFAVLWMGAWMAGFLPWHSLLEYYLLAFAGGLALFTGVVVGELISLLRTSGHGSQRAIVTVLLLISLSLFSITLANNAGNARVQLVVDRSNNAAIECIARLPSNSIVRVNMTAPSEYVFELGLHLAQFRNRPDIRVDYFRFDLPYKEVFSNSFIISPFVRNRFLPSVRLPAGDSSLRAWNLALVEFLGGIDLPIAEMPARGRIFNAAVQRLAYPWHRHSGIDYLSGDLSASFIQSDIFEYGWRLYRAPQQRLSLARPGTFDPNTGLWTLLTTSNTTFTVMFGRPGCLPVVGDWHGTGNMGIGYYDPAEGSWHLDTNLDGIQEGHFIFTGMRPSDVPIAGDWDGNGTYTPGFYRSADSSWHLRNSNTSGGEECPVFKFGCSDGQPLVGDWDGDGSTSIGVLQAKDRIVYLSNRLRIDPATIMFRLPDNAVPLIGRWCTPCFDSVAWISKSTLYRLPLNLHRNIPNSPPPERIDLPDGMPVAGNWSTP